MSSRKMATYKYIDSRMRLIMESHILDDTLHRHRGFLLHHLNYLISVTK
jgi:hypothetical protein